MLSVSVQFSLLLLEEDKKKNENERVNKNFDKFQSGNNSLKNTIDHILTCKYPWGRRSSRSK